MVRVEQVSTGRIVELTDKEAKAYEKDEFLTGGTSPRYKFLDKIGEDLPAPKGVKKKDGPTKDENKTK
jgi:hypothetical protein